MRAQWHLRREHGDVPLTIGIVAAVPLGALLQPAGSSGGAPEFAAAVGLIWLVRQLHDPSRRSRNGHQPT